MKNGKIKNKVEDILADEYSVEELKGDVKGSQGREEGKLNLAGLIYRALLKGRALLAPKQKQILGDQIQHSILAYRRKLIIRRYSVAAVLLLSFGISYFYLANQRSVVELYAEQSSGIPVGGKTQLILSGEESIAIDSKESVIDYSESGNLVEIDESEQINQAVDSRKLAMNTVLVPFGKRTRITLSDHSTVWLNSGSKLVFPAKFAEREREVYLEGEAIFAVKHDAKHPFHVLTRNVDVKVLGTVFNVSAYNDEPKTNTVLVEGAIVLKYAGSSLLGRSSLRMYPGTLASYNATTATLEKQKVNTQLYTSWRDGYLVFDQQPLGDIVKKIARYYGVEIIFQDPTLAYETFSGNLDLQNSAIDVLNVVAEIVNAKVWQKNNQLIISKI